MYPNITLGYVILENYVHKCAESFFSGNGGCGRQGPGIEAEIQHFFLRSILHLNVTAIRVENFEEAFALADINKIHGLVNAIPMAGEYWRYFSQPVGCSFVSDKFVFLNRKNIQHLGSNLFTIYSRRFWLFLWILTVINFVLFVQAKARYFQRWFESGQMFVSFSIVALILGLFANMITLRFSLLDSVNKRPFNNLDDLMEKVVSTKCSLFTVKSYENDIGLQLSLTFGVNRTTVQNVTQDLPKWVKNFITAYRRNLIKFVSSTQDLGDIIEGSTVTDCKVGIDFYIVSRYYTDYLCDVEVLDFPEQIALLSYCYAFTRLPKKLLQNLRTILSNSFVSDLYDDLQRRYFIPKKLRHCDILGGGYSVFYSSLNLLNVKDSFLMIFYGILIGFAVLISEMLFRCLVSPSGTFSMNNRI